RCVAALSVINLGSAIAPNYVTERYMRHLIGILLLALCSYVSAYPVTSYAIDGYINDDPSTQAATNHLSQMNVGDPFSLLMSVQKISANDHIVDIFGVLGTQHLVSGGADGFYYGNDGGLSGLGVNCWGISPISPEDGEQITPSQLYISLRGQELYYPYTAMPDELRLIDTEGRLNLTNFVEGRLSLNFYSAMGNEFDLFGTITGIRKAPVPEPLVIHLMLASVLAVGVIRI